MLDQRPASTATAVVEEVMLKVRTEPQRQARELRDACMLLAARHGLAAQRGGAHLTEVVLDPFRIWLTPSGGRREIEVWHAGVGTAKVLDLRWSGGGDLTVVSFHRGAWEPELLALARGGASLP